MGNHLHHAIIVTSSDRADLDRAHRHAVETMGSLVGPIIDGSINDYGSFLVAPDGSKEGWNESNQRDVERGALCALLGKLWGVDWVQVAFGGDNGDATTRVVRHGDDDHLMSLIPTVSFDQRKASI